MSLGTVLKDARERKGLTVADVAEQTHLLPQMVEEIEQDDFHRFAAAIYGRGFIRLYAECVGENPEPLVQEFSEIYSGARRPAIATRPVKTAPESVELVESSVTPSGRPRIKTRVVETAPEEAEEREAAAPAVPAEDAAPSPDAEETVVVEPPVDRPAMDEMAAPAADSLEASLGELFDPPEPETRSAPVEEPPPPRPRKTARRARPTVPFTSFADEKRTGFSEEEPSTLLLGAGKVRDFLRSVPGRVSLAVAGCLVLAFVLVRCLPERSSSPSPVPVEAGAFEPAAQLPAGDGLPAAFSTPLLPPPDSYVE